ncbi:MAG: flagellar export chaperone FlgN [Gemmatirosa sp.]
MAPFPTPHVQLPTVPRPAPTAYGPGTPMLRVVGGGEHARAPRPASPGGPHAPGTLDALLDSLKSERKLLEDLAATMRRQRAAVGSDDLQTVDDTVFATHRILATLGQARLRRRQLSRLLAGVDEFPMRELEEVVGPQMTDALRGARDELQASAQALAREVDVNRRVLRDALTHGEAHARTLAGVGEESTGGMRYASDGAARPAAIGGGRLVNRTA